MPNKPYTPSDFQTALVELMAIRKVTPAALALAIGVDRGTVKRWLSPKTTHPHPSIDHLVALANHFQVSLDDLVRGGRPVAPPPVAPPGDLPAQRPLIMHRGSPLIRLVREPRAYERNGVEIARRLCVGAQPGRSSDDVQAIKDDLNYVDEDRFRDDLMAAAYGDLLHVVTKSVETSPTLERQLTEQYGLVLCKVAKVDDLQYGVLITVILGALAADYVTGRARKQTQCVGIAGGFSCARMVMSLVQTLTPDSHVQVAPIAVQASANRVAALDSDTLAGMYGYLTGRVHPRYARSLGYPSNLELAARADAAGFRAHLSAVQKYLDDIVDQVTMVVMGLGGDINVCFNCLLKNEQTLARLGNDLEAQQCIGDILFNFVNPQGVIQGSQQVSDQLTCSIGLSGLRKLVGREPAIPVVALVADTYKTPVLRLALEQGYINGLITTEAVVQQLIAETNQAQVARMSEASDLRRP